MKLAVLLLLTCAAAARASWYSNLNYRSPSAAHAGLGIDVPKLQKRMLQKRHDHHGDGNLTFTHGVASV